MIDRSTAPLEMLGEPDDTECPHGIPTGMGVECWQCRYDQLKIDYDDLEQECDELTERVRELAAEIAEPTIKELDILYRIRKAIGDNGKMMQDELVDHIEGLARKVKELGETKDEMYLDALNDLTAEVSSEARKEIADLEQKLKDEASLLAKVQAESLDRARNNYEKIAALERERDSWKEKFEIANNAYDEKVNEIEDLNHDMGEVFKWLKDENTRLWARLKEKNDGTEI